MVNNNLFNFLLEECPEKVKNHIIIFKKDFDKKYEYFESLKTNRLKADTKNHANFEKFELEVYFNSTYFRISELFESLDNLVSKNNYLASIIIIRHLYETLTQLFYVIEKIENYIDNRDFEGFYKLTRLIAFERKELKKPIHVHDYLRYFKKNYRKITPSTQDFSILSDENYIKASNISHPSSEGSINFYGSFYENNHRYLFTKNQKISKSWLQGMILPVLLISFDIISKHEIFLKDFSNKYKKMMKTDSPHNLIIKIEKWDKEIYI